MTYLIQSKMMTIILLFIFVIRDPCEKIKAVILHPGGQNYNCRVRCSKTFWLQLLDSCSSKMDKRPLQ